MQRRWALWAIAALLLSGAWCLHREEGDVVHFEMLTFWADEGAIRRFAGSEMTKAKYYDFDSDFLIEMEPEALHYEVVER